jgi:myo-inositol-1-phosphate synthase
MKLMIKQEGENFGGVPLKLEHQLEGWDSPNSAGVIIDALRCAKVALDNKIGGILIGPSAYFMKTPPIQYRDSIAKEMVEKFVNNRPATAKAKAGKKKPAAKKKVAPKKKKIGKAKKKISRR